MQPWNIQSDEDRIELGQALRWAQSSPFILAALQGPGSVFPDRITRVAPRVLAEWWIFANRFHALHAFVPKISSAVELVEWHSPMARYKLTATSSLGELFGHIEKNKESLKVL